MSTRIGSQARPPVGWRRGRDADHERWACRGRHRTGAFTALPLDRLRQPPDGDEDALFAHRAQYARYLLDLWRAQPAKWG
jgi:hypothetical protein